MELGDKAIVPSPIFSLHLQLNKVIEENSQLRGKRSPSTPPPRSPPPTIAEEEPLQLEHPHVYAQVDKGKVSGIQVAGGGEGGGGTTRIHSLAYMIVLTLYTVL